MSGFTPAEAAAIKGALSAGRVTRQAGPSFPGHVDFEHLPNGGEELTGQSEGPGQYPISRRPLWAVLREEGHEWRNMSRELAALRR